MESSNILEFIQSERDAWVTIGLTFIKFGSKKGKQSNHLVTAFVPLIIKLFEEQGRNN